MAMLTLLSDDFTTGNPGPDFNGKIRSGDNLFSTSMVAIDAATGKYRWHFQQIHHDLWDYDGPSPVVLFDVTINGRVRKAAAEPNKAGWVYILDRTNGRPLIGIDEMPVPQASEESLEVKHRVGGRIKVLGIAVVGHQIGVIPLIVDDAMAREVNVHGVVRAAVLEQP